MKYFISLFFALVIFSSCTIESNIHFAKDYSGSTSLTYDYSLINSMLGEQETASMDSSFMMLFEDDSMKLVLDTLEMKLAEAGLRNFTIKNVDANGLNFSMDFDDLHALNGNTLNEKLLELSGENKEVQQNLPFTQGSTFTKKGKWLIIDFGNSLADIENELSEDDTEGMALQFGDMIQTNSTLSFDRKIKQIDTEMEYNFNKTENKITVSYSVGDLAKLKENGKAPIIKVKLK